MAIFRRRTQTKVAILDQHLALTSMTCRVSSTVLTEILIYITKRRRLFIAQTVATKRHALVNVVCDSQHRRVRRRFYMYTLANVKPK